MTALIELFHSLSKTLDDVVLKVDKDLPLAEDIHPAIHVVGEYAADMLRLPAALAKLEAQKASAEASLPAREKSVRAANHAVTMLAAKLEKLGKSIDRNRLAASNEDPASVNATVSSLAPNLPASRQDIIESLRVEILAAEDALAKAKAAAKKAESNRKGVVTRAANLAKEIDAAKKAIADHAGRLEETIKVLRKTINHLRNRQQKRDRKPGRKASTVPGFDNPDGTPIEFVDAQLDPLPPIAPTDEDIRKMAESQGISIDSDADLEAARQLFIN